MSNTGTTNYIGTIDCTGESGSNYPLGVYKLGTSFKSVGGVYFILRQYVDNGEYKYSPVYVGQTKDLSERFDDHHKAACFKRQGANCVGIYLEDNEQRRLAIERDLVGGYNLPCNG